MIIGAGGVRLPQWRQATGHVSGVASRSGRTVPASVSGSEGLVSYTTREGGVGRGTLR